LAFLAVGLAAALAPFWLSAPPPPTLGPLGTAARTEIAAAFQAAGGSAQGFNCSGSKGSLLLSCSGGAANLGVFRSALGASGWQPSNQGTASEVALVRGKYVLLIESSSRSTYTSVRERATK
jgi:hypothetical protein